MNIQTLQTFLDFMYEIRDKENDGYMLFKNIHKGFNEIIPISTKDALVLLYKLVDDGYVTKKPSEMKTTLGFGGAVIERKPMPLFYISFDGILFKEAGGYIQQSKDIISERIKRESEISNNKLVNKLLVIGTIGATIVGLLVFLWDIYKYYNPIK